MAGATTTITAMIISLDSSFFPRNSGVRPIMRPARNSARIAYMSMPIRPTPTPPKITSPTAILNMQTRPVMGIMLSCMAVHRAVRRHGRRLGPEDGRAYAEADLFPFHVARHTHFGEQRVRLPLGGKGENQSDQEKDRHGGENRPALAAIVDHPAQGKGQRHGYEQDREDLEEVRGARGILEGMGGIGVEETAAVRAELLDRDLRCSRPHGDHLFRPFKGVRLYVRPEGLYDALGREDQRPV